MLIAPVWGPISAGFMRATVPQAYATRMAAVADPFTSTMPEPKPGLAEDTLFACDDSVSFWAGFQRDDPLPALENLQKSLQIASRYASQPDAAAYWAAHAARTAYFLANAGAGLAAFELTSSFGGASSEGGKQRSPKAVVALGAEFIDAAHFTKLLLEVGLIYEQDWKHIKAGDYKAPWDMTLGHRQTSPLYALRQAQLVVAETVDITGRRSRKATPGVWLDAPQLYPRYYLNDFHYQTDGWFSSRSANVYETSTETLFLGSQDAMQRPTLLPLKGLTGRDSAPLRILDLACGTGRFATFVRDNFPAADVTCVDLSPFYLEKARENDDYWRRHQARGQFGGGAVTEMPKAAQFVQANAEALPFAAGSFDAVVCVDLFHELPAVARAKAAAEMARVVAPGGVVSFTDSIQSIDWQRCVTGSNDVDFFASLNEPHYADYDAEDLGTLFAANGLQFGNKYISSNRKTLSFTKPVGGGGVRVV